MGKKSTAQPRPKIQIQPRGIGPISEPNENDVLSGRGGKINSHVGNVKFRDIISSRKKEYLAPTTKKLEKAHIAADIVQNIRNMDPPGRFLKKDGSDKMWYDIGDVKAIKKTGQALREDAAVVRTEFDDCDSDDEQQQQQNQLNSFIHSSATPTIATKIKTEQLSTYGLPRPQHQQTLLSQPRQSYFQSQQAQQQHQQQQHLFQQIPSTLRNHQSPQQQHRSPRPVSKISHAMQNFRNKFDTTLNNNRTSKLDVTTTDTAFGKHFNVVNQPGPLGGSDTSTLSTVSAITTVSGNSLKSSLLDKTSPPQQGLMERDSSARMSFSTSELVTPRGLQSSLDSDMSNLSLRLRGRDSGMSFDLLGGSCELTRSMSFPELTDQQKLSIGASISDQTVERLLNEEMDDSLSTMDNTGSSVLGRSQVEDKTMQVLAEEDRAMYNAWNNQEVAGYNSQTPSEILSSGGSSAMMAPPPARMGEISNGNSSSGDTTSKVFAMMPPSYNPPPPIGRGGPPERVSSIGETSILTMSANSTATMGTAHSSDSSWLKGPINDSGKSSSGRSSILSLDSLDLAV